MDMVTEGGKTPIKGNAIVVKNSPIEGEGRGHRMVVAVVLVVEDGYRRMVKLVAIRTLRRCKTKHKNPLLRGRVVAIRCNYHGWGFCVR